MAELNVHECWVYDYGCRADMVSKSEVDKVIAEKDKEIAELKEERRWRKCSEELPQNGQDVWAYDSKSKSVLCLKYEKSDEGEGFIVFPYKHDFLQNITQWMPFEKPKAPEEASK